MARPADPHARGALIAAARQQFREHGIQKARIEDITAACGLSKGAFYLHYDSKEALFAELVSEFEQKMDSLYAQRTAEEDVFFARRGALGNKDFAERSERLREMDEMQARHDLAALELMWNMRDVIHVLINGSQGTAFDGVIWHAIDREVQRVVVAADRLKKYGVIRTDISSNVMAMMLMGVWVLTMRQMVSQPEKPDFSAMIGEMNRLVGEGLAPRPLEAISPSKTKPKSPVPRRVSEARRSSSSRTLRKVP